MPEVKPPTNHLSSFQVNYHGQVVHTAAKPQVGKVLHPGMGVNHVSVIQAVLWPEFVPELDIALQDIERRGDLWAYRLVVSWWGAVRPRPPGRGRAWLS